jgi:hypothetical protein
MRPNGLTSRRQIVLQLSTPRRNEIRTAEVIGSRCLAADLAIGLPTSPFGGPWSPEMAILATGAHGYWARIGHGSGLINVSRARLVGLEILPDKALRSLALR